MIIQNIKWEEIVWCCRVTDTLHGSVRPGVSKIRDFVDFVLDHLIFKRQNKSIMRQKQTNDHNGSELLALLEPVQLE